MSHFQGYIFNFFCGYNSYNTKTTKLLFFVLFHPGIVSSYKWATKVNSRWVAIIAHCRTSVTEFLFLEHTLKVWVVWMKNQQKHQQRKRYGFLLKSRITNIKYFKALQISKFYFLAHNFIWRLVKFAQQIFFQDLQITTNSI